MCQLNKDTKEPREDHHSLVQIGRLGCCPMDLFLSKDKITANAIYRFSLAFFSIPELGNTSFHHTKYTFYELSARGCLYRQRRADGRKKRE
jgi:hypothetical protein